MNEFWRIYWILNVKSCLIESVCETYLFFIYFSKLFVKMFFFCILFIDFNFISNLNHHKLVNWKMMKINLWFVFEKYIFTLKIFAFLNEDSNFWFILSKINNHWWFNDWHNYIKISFIISSTLKFIFCE